MGPSWYRRIADVFRTGAMENVRRALRQDRLDSIEVYPAPADRLRAYREVPFEEVKVVVLGQCPYHVPGQADGLAFSCARYVSPSLKVILDRLGVPYDEKLPFRLDGWCRQGIFMLNTALTVRRGKAGSHTMIGWDALVLRTIQELNRKERVAWMLWGSRAKAFGRHLANPGHLVVRDVHPQAVNHCPGLSFDGGFDEVEGYSGVKFRDIRQ